jgi:hypothetical protein
MWLLGDLVVLPDRAIHHLHPQAKETMVALPQHTLAQRAVAVRALLVETVVQILAAVVVRGRRRQLQAPQ